MSNDKQTKGGTAKSASMKPDMATLLAPLAEPLRPVRISIFYRLALVLVAMAMVLLPLVYISLIALVGWGVYLHAVYGTAMFDWIPETTSIRNTGRARLFVALIYITPLIAGPIAIFFMIKPFLAPRPERGVPLTIEAKDQPMLFQLVEAVCRAVRAPKPCRIDVDCQVNASAGFRGGLGSLLRRELVLTIGLPLATTLNLRQFVGVLAHEFGHFAQGGAMRLTYIIRSMNNWFMDLVYGRDHWDMWLDDLAAESTHWIISVGVAMIQLTVWLSRRILWVFMWIAHLLSMFLSRQMEYDADRYEMRLAGSDVFESTARALPQIGAAYELAMHDLKRTWGEGKLPDNFPALVRYHQTHLPKEIQKRIVNTDLEQGTGLLATHPATRDRIASARREDAPGVFRFKQPAEIVFKKFDRLCAITSSFTYKLMLGDHYARAALQPTQDLLRLRNAEKAAGEAGVRFYQGCLTAYAPIWPEHEIGSQPIARERAANNIRTIRRTLEPLATSNDEMNTRLMTSFSRLRKLTQAKCVSDAGLRFRASSYGLKGTDTPVIRKAIQGSRGAVTDAMRDMKTTHDLAKQRLDITLCLLLTDDELSLSKLQGMRKRATRLLNALVVYQRQHEAIQSLHTESDKMIAMLDSIAQNQNNEYLGFELPKQRDKLVASMHRVKSAFINTPYPFDHADSQATIAQHLAIELPPAAEIIAIVQTAEQMSERAHALYFRIMCWLGWMGEQVETSLGLTLSPMPVSLDAKTTQSSMK